MKFTEILGEQLDSKDFTAEINTIKARLDQMAQNVQTVDDENKKLLQNNQKLRAALEQTQKIQLNKEKQTPKFQRQGVGTTRNISSPKEEV